MPLSSSPWIAAVRQSTGPDRAPLTTSTGVAVEMPSKTSLGDQVRRIDVPGATSWPSSRMPPLATLRSSGAAACCVVVPAGGTALPLPGDSPVGGGSTALASSPAGAAAAGGADWPAPVSRALSARDAGEGSQADSNSPSPAIKLAARQADRQAT